MRDLPRLGPCGCRRGIERDNCPSCEGTGQLIDWRAYHRLNPVIWIHPDGRRFSELQASRITLAPGERWTTERRVDPANVTPTVSPYWVTGVTEEQHEQERAERQLDHRKSPDGFGRGQ